MRTTGTRSGIAALCFFSLLLAGCYYDTEEVLYPGTFCDTANVTYSGTVSGIVSANCATSGCHIPGGLGPGNFNNYADLKARVDNGLFSNLVLVAKTMPPTYELSGCQIEQLSIWVGNGAPEN
jgi:hypothetical protein